MNRRFFIKGLAVAISCGVYSRSLAQAFPIVGIALPLTGLSFPTAGRIGFYIDYSELDSTGEHVFLVTRTHGTAGSVSVQFSSHGDSHDVVSGQLSWADGDASIQSIRVVVPSKPAGDHRIHLQLSNTTGGATLHFDDYTRAYGVIDDGTVASDTESVFFDTSLNGNGNGSQGSPFNNVYDAIANVGSKRYIYGRGVVSPDGTNQGAPYGESGINCIFVPGPRADENSRVYIRNWPGSELVIDGANSGDSFGFLAKSGEGYHTYRGITFTNLQITRSDVGAGAIWYHYDAGDGINVEFCNFTNIIGLDNNGGVNYYGTNGGKVWRCNFAGVGRFTGGTPDYDEGNNAGVYSYDGQNISVQRCEFESTMSKGTYHKRTSIGKVSINCRFNVFRDCHCFYGISGSSNPSHFGVIISNNLFIGGSATVIHRTENTPISFGQVQIYNNYFFQSGISDEAAIANWGGADFDIFNNIFDRCSYIYSNEKDINGDLPQTFDYNVVYNYSQGFASISYDSYSVNSFASVYNSSFCSKQTTGDPRPLDASTENFSLSNGSSAIAAGISGSDAGLYLMGAEKIGSDTNVYIDPDGFTRPSMCTPPNTSQKIILI